MPARLPSFPHPRVRASAAFETPRAHSRLFSVFPLVRAPPRPRVPRSPPAPPLWSPRRLRPSRCASPPPSLAPPPLRGGGQHLVSIPSGHRLDNRLHGEVTDGLSQDVRRRGPSRRRHRRERRRRLGLFPEAQRRDAGGEFVFDLQRRVLRGVQRARHRDADTATMRLNAPFSMVPRRTTRATRITFHFLRIVLVMRRSAASTRAPCCAKDSPSAGNPLCDEESAHEVRLASSAPLDARTLAMTRSRSRGWLVASMTSPSAPSGPARATGFIAAEDRTSTAVGDAAGALQRRKSEPRRRREHLRPPSRRASPQALPRRRPVWQPRR